MAPEHLGIRSRTVAGRCSWRRRILGGQESAIAEEEASLATVQLLSISTHATRTFWKSHFFCLLIMHGHLGSHVHPRT